MSNPLAQDRSATAPVDPSRDPFNIPSEVKASIRVLVVDDERTLRESCASVLQMDGYNVTLIGRGEEALDTVKRRKFDIILVDLYMSHISGLQILRASHAVMVGREAQDLRLQLMKQNGQSDKMALIGISPPFRKAVDLARKVAGTDASVFISGESGTGKEVIAQFIHQYSRRAHK